MPFGSSSGESLQVKVEAATQDATRGIERVKEKLSNLTTQAVQTAGGLQILQNRVDETEDELGSAGRTAMFTSGSFSALTLSTDGLALSVTGLSGVIAASLVPAFAALAAAIVPVVTALGGFLAVAGAITGLGIVGVFGAVSQATQRLEAAATTLVEEVLTQFAPLFDAFAGVLVGLLNHLTNVVSELVPAQDVIDTLAVSFAILGDAVIEMLPAFADLAATLVSEFLPPFVRFAQDVLPELPGLIRMFVSDFQRLLPMFMSAGRATGRLLGEMREFGFVVLDVLAPALGMLAEAVTGAYQAANNMDAGLQNLVAKGALLAPILTTIVSLLGGVSAPVLAAVGAIAALGRAFQTNFGNFQRIVMNAYNQIKGVLGKQLPDLVRGVEEAFAAWRPIIEPLFNFISTMLAVSLVNSLDIVLSVLNAIVDVLSGDFGEAWNTIAGLIERVVTRIADALNRLTGGMLQRVVNSALTFINEFGAAIEGFAEYIGQGDTFSFERFEMVNLEERIRERRQEQSADTTPSGGSNGGGGKLLPGGAGRETVEVTGELVERDGEITALIDSRTQTQFREQSRRVKRNSGSQ